MKALVTGAAGALGSHMAERLVHEGYEVLGIDALTPYYDEKLKQKNASVISDAGVQFQVVDLAKNELDNLVTDADVVFHFAGQPGISAETPFDDYVRNNIVATERLILSAEKSQTLRAFINIATSSVYGVVASGDEATEPKPTSVYGVTKLAAEQLVLARARSKNFPALSLRIFSVYGERERPDKFFRKLIDAMLSDQEVPLYENSRDHVRSFSYVSDIIDGCMAALTKVDTLRGEIFNLGSEVTHTTGEGIDIIERLMGKKAHFKMMPPRPGDQKETGANIEKAKKILGWEPKVSLEEGLAREIMWCKAQK